MAESFLRGQNSNEVNGKNLDAFLQYTHFVQQQLRVMFIKGDCENPHMMGIGHLASQIATKSNKSVEAVLDTVFTSLREDQSGVLRNLV